MSGAQPELPLNVVPGRKEDRRALAANVYARHGIALREDDPAFALVTLNELVLRRLMSELLKEVDRHIAARLTELDQTMQRAEQCASRTLAHQVRESFGMLQVTMQEEIAGARAGMLRMADEIRSAGEIAIRARWCAAAAVLALVMFGCGFWAGRL